MLPTVAVHLTFFWSSFFAADSHTKLLFTLFIMFLAAKLAAEIFEWIKQPTVAGEILAGVIIGPGLLGLVAPSELTDSLSEIGVIFLLFLVGVQTRPSELLRVGGRATFVAVLGVIVPFIAGFALMDVVGKPIIEAVFVGASMVATSVGITARVLDQRGLLQTEASRIILGAAVIDDVLGLLVLAVISGFAKGSINYAQIVTTGVLAVGFAVIVAFAGFRTVNKIQPHVERLKVAHSFLIFGLIVCLGLALVAAYIGVAAIIGAFLAGMALSESVEGTSVRDQTEAVTEFLLPFFFIGIGMKLNFSALMNYQSLFIGLSITVLAVITKIIGCGLAALPLGKRKALQIGVGMVPRGEVGIVVAQIGLGLQTISQPTYGIVILMAIATTMIAPPFIVRAFKSDFEEIPQSELAVSVGSE